MILFPESVSFIPSKILEDAIFYISNIKILLYFLENERARYSELLKYVIPVRSTLALALRELKEDNDKTKS